jgi:hypothetical protein
MHFNLPGFTMTNYLKWMAVGGVATIAAATISLAGCAAQLPSVPAGIEQKIENASTASDHNDIASQYERQATLDVASAKRHVGYAAIYRKNRSPRSGVQAHENLAKHCDALARTYQEAADQNLALAKLHRELAR